MQLFTMQEIQAMLGLLNRAPMSPAEQLFTQGFFERLVAFCQPPKPEPAATESAPPPPDDAQAMADALAIAEALDEADKETE